LKTKAIEMGAQLLCRRLQQTHYADGVWTLHLDGDDILSTSFLIYASGRNSVAAGIPSARVHFDRQIAATVWLKQKDLGIHPSRATLIEATANGWWYASLLPDERLTLTLFTDVELLPRGVSKHLNIWQDQLSQTQYIRQWLSTAGYEMDQLPQIRAAGTSWLSQLSGVGWVAAGDAALAFDPLSSHGIASALWGGDKVGEAAALYLSGDPSLLLAYEDTLQSVIQDYQHQRWTMYAREQRWPQAPYWTRRQKPHLQPSAGL
jgi:flavin-dependent dehydrogenase